MTQLAQHPFFQVPAVAPIPPEKPQLIEARRATVRVPKRVTDFYAPVTSAVTAARASVSGPIAGARSSRRSSKQSPGLPRLSSIPQKVVPVVVGPRHVPVPVPRRRNRKRYAEFPHERQRLLVPQATLVQRPVTPVTPSPSSSPTLTDSRTLTPELVSSPASSPPSRRSSSTSTSSTSVQTLVPSVSPTTSSAFSYPASDTTSASGSVPLMTGEPAGVRPRLGQRIRRSLSSIGRGVARRVRSIPLADCLGRRRGHHDRLH